MAAKTTAKSITEGKNFRRYKDGDSAHRPWQEEIFQAGWSHKCPTYVVRTPPCSGSCPSGHDIRGWLAIARGTEKAPGDQPWQEYAFRRMAEANPFPAIMGRVCPAPCEQGCNRNAVEEHVGINSIEHHVGNWAIESKLAFARPETETGKHVVVIGGGPAGLSAAYQLRRRGHAVTVLEDKPELGGFMRYGIPGYRTPRDVLDAEIKRIIDMGVTVKTNCRVGRDVTVAELEAGYDALFWGIGTHQGRALPIPGADASNCITGVAFLKAFNEGRLQHVTGRVVVIGGGDTSIDVASVARRLGHIEQSSAQDRIEHVILGQTAHDVATTAKRDGAAVTLTSLFPVDKMMAAKREIDDATREGVDIRASVMPLEVITDGAGRATGLKMCKCTMNGMTPEPIAGTEFTIDADLIVAAIGQKGDLGELKEMDNGHGFINADKTMRVPGKPKHFVGGDIVRPHLLTTAIGHGRVAAASIDEFLAGVSEPSKRPKVDVHHFNLLNKLHEFKLDPAAYDGQPTRGTSAAKFAVHNFENRAAHEIITHEDLFLGHFPATPRHHRAEVHIDAEQVIGNFDERLLALSEKDAIDEAKRCMSCGLCFECDNCVIYCPQDAVHRVAKNERTLGRYVDTDYTRCIGCHICHDVCPTGYIEMGLGE